MTKNRVTLDVLVSFNKTQKFVLSWDAIVEVSPALLSSGCAWVHYKYNTGSARKVLVANTVEDVQSRMEKACPNKK